MNPVELEIYPLSFKAIPPSILDISHPFNVFPQMESIEGLFSMTKKKMFLHFNKQIQSNRKEELLARVINNDN